MTEEIANHPTDKPSSDDILPIRFLLPGSMVKQSEHQIEIHSCAGGVISIPRSVLKVVEHPQGQSSTGPHYVSLATTLPRGAALLFQSLAAEIIRLTREVNDLRGESKRQSAS